MFARLEELLDDDRVALHHVRWIEKQRQRGAKDNEADFIVAHSDHGMLIIEVKGGDDELQRLLEAFRRFDGIRVLRTEPALVLGNRERGLDAPKPCPLPG